MTNFLTALAHLLPVLAVVAVMFVGALLTLPPVGRWADRRAARANDKAGVQYGPRLVYGQLDDDIYLFSADEFKESA